MLALKPRMLVSVAQANETARIVWAVQMRKENYRALVVVTAWLCQTNQTPASGG